MDSESAVQSTPGRQKSIDEKKERSASPYVEKIWTIKASNPIMRQVLADKLKISLITAQLLLNRGIVTETEAEGFLHGTISALSRPESMKNVIPAVQIILQAITDKKRITIYGDYDVDGITGTVILVKMLQKLGAEVNWYIPSRLQEGYGLNQKAVDDLAAAGTELLITVDCGISNYREVEYANQLGLQVIITDHHEVPEKLPPALAVIDPKRTDDAYPFKQLAGAGVGWKLGQALFREQFRRAGYINKAFDDLAALDYLDLVAMGTVADIVPMENENRILVKYGLEQLGRTKHIGLAVFCSNVLPGDRIISEEDITFIIAPRMNAAGRMGQAAIAVELLLTEDEQTALSLTEKLNNINTMRQNIEARINRDALTMIGGYDLLQSNSIILDSTEWHSGVIGIVSARLMDRFKKTVILIAVEDGIGKASCRSTAGINIYQALDHCRQYLLQYGGHSRAAGFSIAAENIGSFRHAISRYIDEHMPSKEVLSDIVLESEISLPEINEQLIREISALQPFGSGNPKPFFCSRGRVISYRLVGKNCNHLKMTLGSGNSQLDAIGFNLGEYEKQTETNNIIDFIFWPEQNHYNGQTFVQLKLKDIKTENDTFVKEQDANHWIINELNRSLRQGTAGRIENWGSNNVLTQLESTTGQMPDIYPADNWQVADRRRCQDPYKYVLNLLEDADSNTSDRKMLVLTADDDQTLEFLSYLYQHGYREKQAAALLSLDYYQQLHDLQQKLQQQAADGEFRCLLSTPAALLNYLDQSKGNLPAVKDIIFCSRIIAKSEILSIVSALAGSQQQTIHFLGSDKEIVRVKELLQMIPDRLFLGKLFVFFKRYLLNNNSINLQKLTMNQSGMDKISSMLGEKVTGLRFIIGVKIFKELGLLQIVGQNVRLNRQAPAKTELTESKTYCRLNSWAEQTAAFQQELDALPPDCLQEIFAG